MGSQLEGPGKTLPNEKKAQLLLSAAEIMNRNDEEENSEVLSFLESSKCTHCMHCNESITAITKTIRNTIIEINEIKERNRERRHKEILEIFKNYLNHSDEPKDLKNTQTSNPKLSFSQTDTKYNINTRPMLKVNKKIDIMKEPKQCFQKDSVNTMESSNVEVIPQKVASTLSNIKVESSLSADAIFSKASQKDELVVMRKKMLAMQRKKMEDRERKKRKVS